MKCGNDTNYPHMHNDYLNYAREIFGYLLLFSLHFVNFHNQTKSFIMKNISQRIQHMLQLLK